MSEQDSISEKHGPMWDHDDLSMATWVEDRLRWCVKKDPNYASLASEGFILDRSRVVVPTQFHGVALREGWLVEASVEDPLPPSFIYNDQPIPGGVDHLQEDDAKVSLRACLRVDEAFALSRDPVALKCGLLGASCLRPPRHLGLACTPSLRASGLRIAQIVVLPLSSLFVACL